MDDSLKYTCIFGGGAVRGISYVGIVRALYELGLKVDSVAGSSVGAVFATFYALGFNADELQELFIDFNFSKFKDINLSIGPDFAFSKGEVFLNWLREIIEKKFYGDAYVAGENPPVKFCDLDKDLYVLTCDLFYNKPFVFSKANTPDYEIASAIKISTSLPGLMKPAEYENKFLVDGDLAKSWPLWKLDSGLCPREGRVLEFRLEGCRECVNIKNPLDYVNAVFSASLNLCTENVLNDFQNKDKFDYIVIDTKDLILIDFTLPVEKRLELIENGYITTMAYFKGFLVEKKKQLLPKYKFILDSVVEIRSMIKSHRINDARCAMYEMLAELHEPLLTIDTAIYADLNSFKMKFLQDYSCIKLFNVYRLKDLVGNVKMLQAVIEKLTAKCDELSEYINEYEQRENGK